MTALDRLVEAAPGRRAVALRNVPNTLEVFTTHFPLFPVLPGVLILDDLVQVARLALGGDHSWTLSQVERIRFRHFVTPGDQMEMAVDVIEQSADRAVCRAVVRVGGRPCTTVQRLVLHRECGNDSTADGAP